MLLLRLSGRKVCERVKTKGYLWKGKHFFVRFLSGAPRNLPIAPACAGIYVGTLTSTKLHKSAVKRNRMRRRCREALRLALKSLPREAISDQRSAISERLHAVRCPLSAIRSFQLLLLPRSSSLSADFGELLKDAEHLLASLTSRAR
ncbi:MAG: ribonuclease P protein component [Candidatus Peribacteraceae bacterium]|nr:ribonuclease P protein component [Candidatus Peribacteraceae bacterium]